jgi:MtN3 and saliva related transmembrane protein
MPKEIIGFLAGIFTTFAALPQILKCVKTKDVSNISLYFLILITTGVFLWFVYGILLNDLMMILFNFIGFILWSILLLLKIQKIINNRNNKNNLVKK